MTRGKIGVAAAVAILVLLFGGRWLAVTYAEHAWFTDLGEGKRHLSLLFRAIRWQALIFAGSILWYGLNTVTVYRSIGSVHLPRRVGDLEIAEAVPKRVLLLIAAGISLLLAIATTFTFRDFDQFVALYTAAVPYGPTEPVLEKDVSFYLAQLPLLELTHLLITISVTLALVLVMGLYALTGNVVIRARRMQATAHARSHLALLLAALGLAIAAGFRLDAYQLVGGGGHLGGALSPADRLIRIPAANALALIALVAATGSLFATRRVRPALLAWVWITLGVAAVLGRLLVPALAQTWGIGSNRPLAAALRNISAEFTRAAFGITDARVANLVPAAEPRQTDLAAALAVLEGLVPWSGSQGLFEAALTLPADTASPRLWTSGTCAYRTGAGQPRFVTVAVPQADPLRLRGTVPRPSWSELHRGRFAWGGEPVAVDASLREGPMRFLSRLEPLDTTPERGGLERAGGRIRFLPRPAELAILGPDEVSVGEDPPGVALRHRARRVLLAWALQSPPLMGRRTSVADRVIYWRDVPTRLAKLYRFASFEPAYPVMADGRLLWVSEGYLMSDRYPLVPHLRWRGDQINYLAPAFLATVDAVSGRTRVYLRGPESRLAMAAARAEQVEPLPAESLPSSLRARLPYPAAMFAAQVVVIARRGEADSAGARPWSLADRDTAAALGEISGLRATQALLSLDGPMEPWTIAALTDAGGNRLAALVAARLSAEGAHELRVLRVVGSHPTPAVAAARLAAVAATVRGGDPRAVRRGPVHVLPVGGALLYAQVVFATTDPVNEPFGVAGAAAMMGTRLGYGASARDAITSLERGTMVLDRPGSDRLNAARAAFQALDSARQRGDWEAFGRAWETLRRLLLEPAPQRQ